MDDLLAGPPMLYHSDVPILNDRLFETIVQSPTQEKVGIGILLEGGARTCRLGNFKVT